MDPEQAIEHARERAQRRQAEADAVGRDPAAELDASITAERPGFDLLSEWSVIEVDDADVYSTRRGGAPITAFKRLLLRLLGQYHRQLEARQTRFNIALLSHFRDLEERVARLEREAAGLAPEHGGSTRAPGRATPDPSSPEASQGSAGSEGD